MLTSQQIWAVLAQVADPELPVVNLVEMGIVRGVHVEGERVTVTITPTFSGCPALHTMKGDILARLHAEGVDHATVEVTLSPAWSSDWIQESAREKLKAFGLAPPPMHSGDIELALTVAVACPYCGSKRTTMKNAWGPTLCRAIYYCENCRQGFEQFKPL